MLRAVAICVFSIGCVPTESASPREARVASPNSVAAPPTRCAEPKSIAAAPGDKIAAILAEDPEAPNDWRRGADDHLAIDDGPRRYLMTLEGAISATANGNALWAVPPMQVAGGGFNLLLSPAGRVVVRLYSRGGLELFDANTGKLLRKVGSAVPSPNDDFVVEVPRIPFGLDAWDRDDVRVLPIDPSEAPRSLTKLPLQASVEFGAAVCSLGNLVAVSFTTTELAIYRARDGQKLASVASPGIGAPVFTRSGRYVVLREGDQRRAVFQLRE